MVNGKSLTLNEQ